VVVAVVAALVASWPAPGVPASLRIESVAVQHTAASVAGLVETNRACRPRIATAPIAGGRRVRLDFPPGTRVDRAVHRVLWGAGPLRRVVLGATAEGGVRIVVDLAGAAPFAMRRPPTGHGFALVLATRAPPRAAARSARDATPPPAHRALRVTVDPGHGGDDPGATGLVQEKEVTLVIARQLAALLRAGLRADVTLTRTGDESVPLEDRTRRANLARADLFVSIHANASARRAARGVETYYLDNTEDQATLRLASIENGDAIPSDDHGTDLDYILSSLVQGGKQGPSIRLAERVQAGLVGRLQAEWTGVVDLGTKRGPFYVLVGAYMPCILVEASFLTHPEEGRRLADPTYQRAIAEGIYRGVVAFLQTDDPEGTL
jgi:N-acetylmuramoyl-L-alanine amidase